MADTAPTVIVEEKSSFLSKINWGEAIKVALAALALFGINVPSEMQSAILGLIIAIGAVYTVVVKTFFTTTITPSSASKL
jgi:Na+/H+ antiporter NhaA